MSAAERWSAALAGWAIPSEILAQAPESPWGFPPGLFGAHDVAAGTVHRLAAAALTDERSVLDIGCGGGAGSIPLAPFARSLVGVDASPAMLALFAAGAEAAGVAHVELLGEWPAVATLAPSAEVVVCRDVVYNVADIVPFVIALSAHATRRVVVGLTAVHPSVALAPLWRQFWGLDRPDGPGAALFADVVADLGYEPAIESEARPVDKSRPDVSDYVSLCAVVSACRPIATRQLPLLQRQLTMR